MSETRDALERAADIIEFGGHHKGAYTNGNGAYCLAGSIFKAVELDIANFFEYKGHLYNIKNGNETSISQDEVASNCIEAIKDFLDIESIPAWNDADETTQEMVIDVLRTVAKEYDN